MWLINVDTLQLEEFVDPHPPEYAILSHTWDDEEVLFRDMCFSLGSSPTTRQKKGFAKIEKTCEIAQSAGLQYAWIDTCCIDKSSSAELSEAINSMFQWYEKSTICYAFLSDLDPDVEIRDGLAQCRWFTRGWTLQELIAPRNITFVDSQWRVRFSNESEEALSVISEITRIDQRYLTKISSIHDASISLRMSWAARRQTTRPEDIAYCLLGLFGINIPLLYGEGAAAFQRLQEAIIHSTNDMSIFGWLSHDPLTSKETISSVFAESPAAFKSPNIDKHGIIEDTTSKVFSMTNFGIRMSTTLYYSTVPDSGELQSQYFLYLGHNGNRIFSYLVLRKWQNNRFFRDNSVHRGVMRTDSLPPYRIGIRAYYVEDLFLISRPIPTTMARSFLNDLESSTETHLTFSSEIQVYDAKPQSAWDPARAVLGPGDFAAIFHIGLTPAPRQSVRMILLSHSKGDFVFIISSHSPVVPYIEKRITEASGIHHIAECMDSTPLIFEHLPESEEGGYVEVCSEGFHLRLIAVYYPWPSSRRFKDLLIESTSRAPHLTI